MGSAENRVALVNPIPALIAALIWAFSPIYYGVYLKKFGMLTLNFIRTSLGAGVLLLPALYFGFQEGAIFAVLSGVITLAVGDSLFLISIREVGAAVSTPVVYTYVLLIQLTAFSVGESVLATNIVSATLIIVGVLLLSRGGRAPRIKGIMIALGASLIWTVGQDLLKVASSAGLQFVSLAFLRDGSAAIALGLTLLVRGHPLSSFRKKVTPREGGYLALVSITDLALGSAIYVYSVSTTGLALTVILTSLSPFLTQVFSKLLGKETPTNRDILAGFLIVLALLIVTI
ncbi:MAG TPA: DMT family transporter [Nitrososphaerales archaeon]|nr:DMT family transporter [Nitrososphaerales archaeon]